MEDEPEEGEDRRKEEGAKEAGAEKVKAEPEKEKTGVRQPCILIFDSLAGGSKARTCQTLRLEHNL